MIDFNNPHEIKAIRRITAYPEWQDFSDYVENELSRLQDEQDKADTFEKVLGNREARKTIKEIMLFMNEK